MFIVALVIATAVPLIFFYIIYNMDLYRTGAFGAVAGCFIWGLAAFGLAYYINPAVGRTFQLDWKTVIVPFVAPVLEEILKALVLIYLVRRPNFTYFVDGAIYGFAAGMGFAIIENYSYVMGNTNQALGLAVSRVLSTNLIHASASALVGIALGYARFQTLSLARTRRVLGLAGLLAAGWALGMTLHIVFNNLVMLRVSGGLVLLFAIVVGFGAAGMVAFFILRGLKEEKGWIEEKLGALDRVTASEVSAVGKLSEAQKMLAPVAERFGEKKAGQIESFLVLQARIGILRKSWEKISDPKMKAAIEKQIADLSKEMNTARRAVGSYCMLYLRQTFLVSDSPLWGRLEKAIEEKMATRPANSGPSLWDKAGARISARTASRAAADKPAAGENDTGETPSA